MSAATTKHVELSLKGMVENLENMLIFIPWREMLRSIPLCMGMSVWIHMQLEPAVDKL